MITDWLMVVITAVYVIATIFICVANIKSARATREQLAEAKRQYEEEHRPYVTYQLIFERRTWYGMRFTNHGRREATHVQIKFSQDFLNSISKPSFSERLHTLQNKEFALGIGQSYDIYFGADEFRKNPSKKPIVGEITYQDAQTTYHNSFDIDFENYATFYSVNSPTDDLHNDMQKLTEEVNRIAQILKTQQAEKSRPPSFLCKLSHLCQNSTKFSAVLKKLLKQR